MPRKYSIHGHLSCRGTPAPFVPAIWLQSNQISMNIKAWFHRNVLSGLDNIIQKYNKLYRPLWLSACIWPSVYQPPRLAWNITPLVYSPRDVFLLFCFFLNRVRYIFLCLHLNVICGKKIDNRPGMKYSGPWANWDKFLGVFELTSKLSSGERFGRKNILISIM